MEREKLIDGFGEVRNKRSEKGSDGEKEVENIFFPINSTFNVQRNRLEPPTSKGDSMAPRISSSSLSLSLSLFSLSLSHSCSRNADYCQFVQPFPRRTPALSLSLSNLPPSSSSLTVLLLYRPLSLRSNPFWFRFRQFLFFFFFFFFLILFTVRRG